VKVNDILGSVFIATVIAAVINALSNTKINFTQYFSKERNEWRREIRTIAEELENCRSYRTLSAILTKLKLRINPYGKNMMPVENNEVTVGIMQDAHIWEIIEKMEKEKRDFKGNIYWVVLRGTLILSLIYVTYNHFYVLKKDFNIEYMMWILLAVEMPAGIAGIVQCIKDMGNYKQKKVLYVLALLGLGVFGVYEMNSLVVYYGGIGMIKDFDFLFTIVVYLI
jgi:membrane protein